MSKFAHSKWGIKDWDCGWAPEYTVSHIMLIEALLFRIIYKFTPLHQLLLQEPRTYFMPHWASFHLWGHSFSQVSRWSCYYYLTSSPLSTMATAHICYSIWRATLWKVWQRSSRVNIHKTCYHSLVMLMTEEFELLLFLYQHELVLSGTSVKLLKPKWKVKSVECSKSNIFGHIPSTKISTAPLFLSCLA